MAVALQSSQTAAFTGGTSLVITKPVSLAVGDLLVAQLTSSNSGTPPAFNLPAGWTQQLNVLSAGTLEFDVRLQVMTKVADSADVAASNFTFTIASSTIGGALSRITGFGKVSGSSSGVQNDSTASPFSFSGFTPDRTDCLYMIFACANGPAASGIYPSFSGYGVATDNPSWTEAYDFTYSPNDRLGMAMGYASRAAITATGNVTVSLSLPSNTDTAVGIIAISPTLSATSTPAALVIDTVVNNLLSPASAYFGVAAPTTNVYAPTQWTNETPVATDWTNETQ